MRLRRHPDIADCTRETRLLIKTICLAGMATYHRTFARSRAHPNAATMSIEGRFLAARLFAAAVVVSFPPFVLP